MTTPARVGGQVERAWRSPASAAAATGRAPGCRRDRRRSPSGAGVLVARRRRAAGELLLGRALADRDRDASGGVPSRMISTGTREPTGGVGDQVGHRLVGGHLLAVDADDDVALLDAGAGGRLARLRPSGRSRRCPWAGRAMRRYSRRAAGGRRRDSRADGRWPRRSESITGLASSAGMARPMPTTAPVGEISAELMPMTLPLRSNIGPPRIAHVDATRRSGCSGRRRRRR